MSQDGIRGRSGQRWADLLVAVVLSLGLFGSVMHRPASAQTLIDEIFSDRFVPIERFGPFPFTPNQPISVSFICGLLYLDDMTLSRNTYFFEFREDSSVLGAFRTDSAQLVQLTGQYVYQNNQIQFNASNGFGADFNLGTLQIEPRLGLVGYFASRGTALARPGELRCLAIGHGYNSEQPQYKRFRCPSQPTLAGSFENTIEIDFFDSSINAFFPGSAFRQRDFYSVGNISGNPDRIERSSNGIYREFEGRYYFDFSNPPGIDPPFSDWFQAIADRVTVSGTEALLIPDFDPPINACQRVQ